MKLTGRGEREGARIVTSERSWVCTYQGTTHHVILAECRHVMLRSGLRICAEHGVSSLLIELRRSLDT